MSEIIHVGQPEKSNEPLLPLTTEMSFSDFTSHWKSVNGSVTDGHVVSFRVWCEKRNDWLLDKASSGTSEGQSKFEQHRDRYIREKNSLKLWMELVWEFLAGNSALEAGGRTSFLST